MTVANQRCCLVDVIESSRVHLTMNKLLFSCFFLLINAYYGSCIDYYQPEQIHLSFGENTREIVVTWSTWNATDESVVEYGIGGLILEAKGNSEKFVDGGKQKRSQYIHRVTLKNLKPSSKYTYHCGSSLGWSELFSFRTVPDGDDWSPSLAIYGDMGNINAQSLPRLQEDVQREMYDAILHIGDFAYDMDSMDGMVGDAFMNQIQPIAGYLPYMVCPGNHEARYNFSNYRKRFSMPGGKESLMYSFNFGPVHFISISTEVYYFFNFGIKLLVNQYEWLENDLIEANKIENREKRPWIVVYGHRPMYCKSQYGECNNYESATRTGTVFLHSFGLEELLYNYGVDLEIWAHEHDYERLWPIYDYNVYNGSHEKPYENPQAPVHLITGSAGCQEGREPFVLNPPEWSAFHSQDYGYTRMKVHNKTHLYWEQVSDDKNGSIIDHVWLVKHEHGKYPERKHLGKRKYVPKNEL